MAPTVGGVFNYYQYGKGNSDNPSKQIKGLNIGISTTSTQDNVYNNKDTKIYDGTQNQRDSFRMNKAQINVFENICNLDKTNDDFSQTDFDKLLSLANKGNQKVTVDKNTVYYYRVTKNADDKVTVTIYDDRSLQTGDTITFDKETSTEKISRMEAEKAEATKKANAEANAIELAKYDEVKKMAILNGMHIAQDLSKIGASVDTRHILANINKYNAIPTLKGYYNNRNLTDCGFFQKISQHIGVNLNNQTATNIMKAVIDNVPEDQKDSKDYRFLLKTYEEYMAEDPERKFHNSKFSAISHLFGIDTLDNLDDAVERLFELY